MASSEADLTALKGDWREDGLTWTEFGNCTQNDLDGLKLLWFPKNVVKQIKLQDLWTRHHDRRQSRFDLTLHSVVQIFLEYLNNFLL